MKPRFKVILAIGIYLVLIGSANCILLVSFQDHGFNIMRNLNSEKTTLRSMFDRNYNFTELYQWEHDRVMFVKGDEEFERSDDPIRILQIGKGKCGEFSTLYVALCLAHGYESRLVVAADIGVPLYFATPHSWAEVKVNEQWVHIDPSDQVWNQKEMYGGRSWGKRVGLNVCVYAFEDGRMTDITWNYVNVGSFLRIIFIFAVPLAISFLILYKTKMPSNVDKLGLESSKFEVEANENFLIFWAVLLFTCVVGIIELLALMDQNLIQSWAAIPISLLYMGLLLGVIFSISRSLDIMRENHQIMKSGKIWEDLKTYIKNNASIFDSENLLSIWFEAIVILAVVIVLNLIFCAKANWL